MLHANTSLRLTYHCILLVHVTNCARQPSTYSLESVYTYMCMYVYKISKSTPVVLLCWCVCVEGKGGGVICITNYLKALGSKLQS